MRSIVVRSSDLDRCPAGRLDAKHFKSDGSCKCWTRARVEALEVLRRAHTHGGVVRESNATSRAHGTVYWQSRAWLQRNGLVLAVPGPRSAVDSVLALTEKGLAACRDVLASGRRA